MGKKNKIKNKKIRNQINQAPLTAVDVVIFTVEEKILKIILIKIKSGPLKGMWAFPGWRVKIHETLDKAAARELYENTTIKNAYLEQLYSFSSVKRDPVGRIISVAYLALVNFIDAKLKTSSRYLDIRWFPVEQIPRLAYDHKEMLNHALERLKNKLEYSNVIYSLLPRKFTLSDLQKAYEIILQKKIDKRNFRKKILSLNLIKKVGEKRGEAYRPANLYSFKKRKFSVAEIF